MRSYRLIIPFLILAACKATAPTSSTSNYSEDLSVYRASISKSVSNEEVDEISTEKYVELTGHIKAELDSIAKIAYLENKKGKMVEGYVIQVYSGNDRDKANEVQSEMNSSFPKLQPKVTYHQPNFRVKAGKFTNRLEANRVHRTVKKQFPRALLIPDRFRLAYE
ncbi:MAG: SPOR domain-containing protein [Ekhidna sp.]|nr:SPOR domain-containing protein [Ekhidna sp.]